MTVLFINCLSARRGGGRTYVQNFFKYLPELLGDRIYVFLPSDLKLILPVGVTRVDVSPLLSHPLLRTLWEVLILPLYLWRYKAEVLFCPGGLVLTPVFGRCKIVTMFRNMLPFDREALRRMKFDFQYIRNKLLRWLLVYSLNRADLVVFISGYAKNFISDFGYRDRNSLIIPHGINEVFLTPKTSNLSRTSVLEGEWILYVSRFDVYKHHLNVVEAYALLHPGIRSQLKLVFIGEIDSPVYGDVVHLIDQLGLTDDINILGPVDYSDLPVWYSRAKMILFASSCENCPNILLESLGAGVPVLSSSVMPMPEFGGPGIAYFDPYDPVSIHSCIDQVVKDSDYARTIADAAYQRSFLYSWSDTIARTMYGIRSIV